jgi:hypothetical protein
LHLAFWYKKNTAFIISCFIFLSPHFSSKFEPKLYDEFKQFVLFAVNFSHLWRCCILSHQMGCGRASSGSQQCGRQGCKQPPLPRAQGWQSQPLQMHFVVSVMSQLMAKRSHLRRWPSAPALFNLCGI